MRSVRILISIPLAPQDTYSDLLAQIEADPPQEWTGTRPADVTGKIRWLIRKQGWDPRTKVVSRREVVDFFEKATGAELGLTDGSKATYKSLIMIGLDVHKPRGRRRDISDVPGIPRDLYLAAKDDVLGFPQDMIFAAGPFLLHAHDQGIALGEITTETLRLYFEHRMASGTKIEKTEKKHTKRVAAFLTRVANEPALAGFAVQPVAHPFSDGRDKYQVPDHLLAPLLKEFDEQVVPWARGETSRDGLTRAELVARLDAEEPQLNGKEALLQGFVGKDPKSRREARDKAFREAGFLPRDQTWQGETPGTRRGYVVAFCKALHAGCGYLVESVAELVQPAVVEAGATALYEANLGAFESGYVASVLKAIKKIACGYCCCSPEDLKKIRDLITAYETNQDGISERNKAKLQGFTETRLDAFINLGSLMIAEVNARAERNRRRIMREEGRKATLAETFDIEMVRDVAAALAHEILLKRAPRTENVLGIPPGLHPVAERRRDDRHPERGGEDARQGRSRPGHPVVALRERDPSHLHRESPSPRVACPPARRGRRARKSGKPLPVPVPGRRKNGGSPGAAIHEPARSRRQGCPQACRGQDQPASLPASVGLDLAARGHQQAAGGLQAARPSLGGNHRPLLR